MDKQIEEMEKTLYDYRFHYDDCIEGSETYLAKFLVNRGWIKPTKNVVVLTSDELRLYNENLERDRAKLKTIRKETAEKFAKMALQEIKAISGKSEYLLEDESVYEDSALENILEKVKIEIAKEIIGEKK